jgi:Trypsin-co-occurring domain 2
MRRIVWLLFLVVWPLGGIARPVANEADLSVADLVREVKIALLKVAEAVEAQDLPKLDKAELEVNTSIKTDGDGKVALWVVELGASGKNEYASTVTLTLRPPPPGSPSNIGVVHLADALSEAILAGARAILVGRGKAIHPCLPTSW